MVTNNVRDTEIMYTNDYLLHTFHVTSHSTMPRNSVQNPLTLFPCAGDAIHPELWNRGLVYETLKVSHLYYCVSRVIHTHLVYIYVIKLSSAYKTASRQKRQSFHLLSFFPGLALYYKNSWYIWCHSVPLVVQ